MKLILIPALLCLVACKPKAPDEPQSKNARLPRLPVAEAAEKLEGEIVHFIELQYTNDKWNVDGGLPVNDEEELTSQIKSAKDALRVEGYHPRALIEANPSTPQASAYQSGQKRSHLCP